jgi:hypothetical protein
LWLLVRGDICSCVFSSAVEREYLLVISEVRVRSAARDTMCGELVLHIFVELEDVDRVVDEGLWVSLVSIYIYTMCGDISAHQRYLFDRLVHQSTDAECGTVIDFNQPGIVLVVQHDICAHQCGQYGSSAHYITKDYYAPKPSTSKQLSCGVLGSSVVIGRHVNMIIFLILHEAGISHRCTSQKGALNWSQI